MRTQVRVVLQRWGGQRGVRELPAVERHTRGGGREGGRLMMMVKR